MDQVEELRAVSYLLCVLVLPHSFQQAGSQDTASGPVNSRHTERDSSKRGLVRLEYE